MKTDLFSILIISFLLIGCNNDKLKKELQSYAATESYPEDKYLATVTEKRALVVGAHFDDDVIMAGTISMLQQDGWEIKRIVFSGEDEDDDRRLVKAFSLIGDNVEFIELKGKDYRNDLDTVEYAYMPLKKEHFKEVFNRSKVVSELVKKVNRFNPTVIFTLDNELGGYGHPDHIFLSQLVIDLCKEKAIHPDKIYQGVYTNNMEKEIIEVRLTQLVAKWGFPSPYVEATRMYNMPFGMPEPNVEINIQSQAESKMQYIKGFSEKEQQTIGKFMPHYNELSPEEYFQIFDREFYRVIELE